MEYIRGQFRRNEIGRWSIVDSNSREELFEITSGCAVELFEDGEWKVTPKTSAK